MGAEQLHGFEHRDCTRIYIILIIMTRFETPLMEKTVQKESRALS